MLITSDILVILVLCSLFKLNSCHLEKHLEKVFRTPKDFSQVNFDHFELLERNNFDLEPSTTPAIPSSTPKEKKKKGNGQKPVVANAQVMLRFGGDDIKGHNHIMKIPPNSSPVPMNSRDSFRRSIEPRSSHFYSLSEGGYLPEHPQTYAQSVSSHNPAVIDSYSPSRLESYQNTPGAYSQGCYGQSAPAYDMTNLQPSVYYPPPMYRDVQPALVPKVHECQRYYHPYPPPPPFVFPHYYYLAQNGAYGGVPPNLPKELQELVTQYLNEKRRHKKYEEGKCAAGYDIEYSTKGPQEIQVNPKKPAYNTNFLSVKNPEKSKKSSITKNNNNNKNKSEHNSSYLSENNSSKSIISDLRKEDNSSSSSNSNQNDKIRTKLDLARLLKEQNITKEHLEKTIEKLRSDLNNESDEGSVVFSLDVKAEEKEEIIIHELQKNDNSNISKESEESPSTSEGTSNSDESQYQQSDENISLDSSTVSIRSDEIIKEITNEKEIPVSQCDESSSPDSISTDTPSRSVAENSDKSNSSDSSTSVSNSRKEITDITEAPDSENIESTILNESEEISVVSREREEKISEETRVTSEKKISDSQESDEELISINGSSQKGGKNSEETNSSLSYETTSENLSESSDSKSNEASANSESSSIEYQESTSEENAAKDEYFSKSRQESVETSEKSPETKLLEALVEGAVVLDALLESNTDQTNGNSSQSLSTESSECQEHKHLQEHSSVDNSESITEQRDAAKPTENPVCPSASPSNTNSLVALIYNSSTNCLQPVLLNNCPSIHFINHGVQNPCSVPDLFSQIARCLNGDRNLQCHRQKRDVQPGKYKLQMGETFVNNQDDLLLKVPCASRFYFSEDFYPEQDIKVCSKCGLLQSNFVN